VAAAWECQAAGNSRTAITTTNHASTEAFHTKNNKSHRRVSNSVSFTLLSYIALIFHHPPNPSLLDSASCFIRSLFLFCLPILSVSPTSCPFFSSLIAQRRDRTYFVEHTSNLPSPYYGLLTPALSLHRLAESLYFTWLYSLVSTSSGSLEESF
jgi:hypothetical protein